MAHCAQAVADTSGAWYVQVLQADIATVADVYTKGVDKPKAAQKQGGVATACINRLGDCRMPFVCAVTSYCAMTPYVNRVTKIGIHLVQMVRGSCPIILTSRVIYKQRRFAARGSIHANVVHKCP